MTQSLTEENYLKVIYNLSRQKGSKITPTAIAEEMGVNAASVVDMIRKLSEKKLISYDKVKGAKLSDKGHKIALGIVRNHRLWETFLLEKLGYSWDVVHEIAEQLEHIRHPELADRLDKFLGFPQYDPHGDPIPKSTGEMPTLAKQLLSDVAPGKTCRVVAVKDTSPSFLQYLIQLSVGIGTSITVMQKIPFDGSMQIEIGNGGQTMVSQKLAESILVD